MTALTETSHPCAALVSEANGFRSRAQITIDNSQDFDAGTVLAKRVNESAGVTAGTPASVGTGNGTVTMANPAFAADVMEGLYRVRLVGETADLGDFEVIRPDGTVDGTGKVGTAYTGQIKFTMADGSTNWTIGSGFNVLITLTDAATTWCAHNPDGTDGSQVAAGVAIYPAVTAADTHAKIAAWVRDCELRSSDLIWPHSGITAAEKAKATAELAALGIILR